MHNACEAHAARKFVQLNQLLAPSSLVLFEWWAGANVQREGGESRRCTDYDNDQENVDRLPQQPDYAAPINGESSTCLFFGQKIVVLGADEWSPLGLQYYFGLLTGVELAISL
jgi:hypothetical protein